MSNSTGVDLAKVEEIFSHPYNVYGAPFMPPQPYDCGQPGLVSSQLQYHAGPALNQETTQYVTIRPKTTSSVTIRPPIDRTRTASADTTTSSSSQVTSRGFSSGSGTTYDHDSDTDHHYHHHRRRRWWYPNYYYLPNPWVDSYYPTYPYDPAMNSTIREALLYKCMWDGDGNPGLCDHVFATEAYLSTPWYKPWAWDWRYPIRVVGAAAGGAISNIYNRDDITPVRATLTMLGSLVGLAVGSLLAMAELYLERA